MKIVEMYENTDDITIESYLVKCGVKSEEVDRYLCPDESCFESLNHYKNMEKGWERLKENIHRNIYIVQDCDPDGLFSSVLAYNFLCLITDSKKIDFLYHSKKEHGLTPEIMEQIKLDSFVWIPDAGTNDVEQCKELIENRDCEILITDHHAIEEENPYAIVISNQKEGIENKEGSGTLVTFKFIQYCCNKFGIKDCLNWFDIVAFANIADIMSMVTLENRVFNHIGLNHINNSFLKFLCNKLIKDDITPTTIAWNVIPKINATIRQKGIGMKKALTKALVSGYCYSVFDASLNKFFCEIYDELLICHKNQTSLANMEAKRLLRNIDGDNNIIIAFAEKNPYTGLVANKIQSEKNKPVLLVHEEDGNYVGSCRSPFEVRGMMNETGLFNFCLGHSKACGVSFPAENTNKIISFFNQLDISDAQECKVLCKGDCDNLPSKLFNLNSKYNYLWGVDVPEPKVYFYIECNGQDWEELRGNVIKLRYDNLMFIKFFVSKAQKKQWHIGENIKLGIDIIGKCCYNVWEGRRTKQIKIEEMEAKNFEVESKQRDWSDLF